MASQRKLDMAGIHSTVGKRAKRLLDTTVETSIVKNKNGFKIAGQIFSKSITMLLDDYYLAFSYQPQSWTNSIQLVVMLAHRDFVGVFLHYRHWLLPSFLLETT